MQHVENVSCRIPVFAAVRDTTNEEEVSLWRNAKYTVTSPRSKESVDFYIDRARDDIGAYKEGEFYPVNATQLVVSTRSENPALATMRIHGLNWANYTRPSSIKVVYEEKEGVDMNVTVSVGKLCTKLTCPQQELNINQKSTFIFSPAIKADLDRQRKERGDSVLYDGYKRYVGTVSIPYAQSEILNGCAVPSLPGAEAGVEAGNTSYNVDTDAFTVNVYFEQISNESRAVRVGEHVGFLTVMFRTEFSDYLGPTNSILLAAHIKHIFNGINTNAETRVAAYTDLAANYTATAKDMVVKGPCQLLCKDGKTHKVGGMVRVPLSNGAFSCVPRPARIMLAGGEVMKATFAKEWKRRRDPKYAQYEKIARKMKMHETALRHIRDEMDDNPTEDGFRMLTGEENMHLRKLEAQHYKMDMLMRVDLKQLIETVVVKEHEIVSNTLAQDIRPGLGSLLSGDLYDVLNDIHDGILKEKVGYAKATIRDETKNAELTVAATPLGDLPLGDALLAVDKTKATGQKYASLCTAMLIPATFKEDTASTASVGHCLLSAAIEEGSEEYIGNNQFVHYPKATVSIPLDARGEEKMAINSTEKMPVVNIIPPIYSVAEEEGENGGSLTLIAAVNSFGLEPINGEKRLSRNKLTGKKEPKKKHSDTREIYRRLQNPKDHRVLAAGEQLPFRATYIPESIATTANRNPIAEITDIASAAEYMLSGSFIPESRYTIQNAPKANVSGLLSMNMRASGRSVAAFIVHAKKGDEWWCPENTGGLLDLDATKIGDSDVTLRDVCSAAVTTTDAQLLVSTVPMYDENFSKKVVRLTPIGDSATSQSMAVYAFALGEQAVVDVEVDGAKEERKGGVMFCFVAYETIAPNFVVSLPSEMPSGDSIAPVTERDNLFLYHHIAHRITLTGSEELPDRKNWDIGYTVLDKLPRGFPNYVVSGGGSSVSALDVDETYLTFESFNTTLTNYNS